MGEFRRFATVTVEGGMPKPLSYGVPDELTHEVERGSWVRVPVRGHPRLALVQSLSNKSSFPKVQPILEVVEQLPSDLIALTEWMADYYATPLSVVMRTAMPGGVRRETSTKKPLFVTPNQTREALRELCTLKRTRSPAQARALENLLKVDKGLLLTEFLEKASVSRATVTSLEKLGAIKIKAVDPSPLADQSYFPTEFKTLTGEQQTAFDQLTSSLDAETFSPHLLFGVTGSGKTEVYLWAIRRALELGKSALILVPEIALTAQTFDRFRSRFDEKIALLHHKLSDGERAEQWRKIQSGEVQIVLGARSAIFSPLKNLGLVIVDEEHEGSYKQSDKAPFYQARDVAVMRGKLSNATVILGSATPSLESMYNAQEGKYNLLTLKGRAENAKLPKVEIIDMRIHWERSRSPLSDPLLSAIRERWEVGEQSLLFLNRRGYHSMLWCNGCHQGISCPHCDTTLTFHKGAKTLACHLCGHSLTPPPRTCPSCDRSDLLKFRGVGTEQVQASLHAIFPEIRTLRIDADTTKNKGAHERLFRQFRSGKADVLIGTQMIAKGLHFPQVTLVGVLNSDASLSIPDFRSSERTFQLLTQVAGRAGRAELAGTVLIQSSMPDHPIIKLASHQDYTSFYEQEIEARRLFKYPPFSRLTKVSFSGKDERKTENAALAIHTQLKRYGADLLPVTPCGHAKIKDHFRFQFLMKGGGGALKHLSPPKDVRMVVDVDPLSTYF